MAFAAGYLVGISPFLILVQAIVPGLDDLVLLIPQSLVGDIGSATALLTGLSAAVLQGLSPGVLRKVCRIGAAMLPVGLSLVAVIQLSFVVRLPKDGGRKVLSIIVGRARIPSCPCASANDIDCVHWLTVSPAALRKCWDSREIRTNEALWSLGYLLAVGGLCACAGLAWSRGASVRQEARPTSSTGVPERRIFLSYSSRDDEFAERLERDLAERGIAVWRDQGELQVGDSLPGKIAAAIVGSTWFGVVLSPDAVGSQWVQMELDTALAREIETRSITVLPLLHRPCDIPAALLGKKRADFTVSYDDGLAALLRTLGNGDRPGA